MAWRGFAQRRWILLGAVLLFVSLLIFSSRVSPPPPQFAKSVVVTELSPHLETEKASEQESLKDRRKREAAAERLRETDGLFNDLRVLSIEIEIPEEGEAALRRWHWRRGGSRPEAQVSVREGEQVYRDVALQLKGSAGSFRPLDDEPGLTLQFDKNTPDQRFHGLKKLSLNNSLQDPSLVSEKICRELFLAAGVPAPRAAHARVKLNGRDLGIYVLVEGFNRQFLKRHFAETSGNLFDSGFVQDITEDLPVNCGDHPEDRSCLDRLTEAASEPDETTRLKKLEEVLDVDRFLVFVALETMTCHWDGYALNRNNYRVFHDLESGRAVFLPHGLDQVFGTGRGSTSQSIVPRARGLLAAAILETSAGRARYVDTFTALYHKVFDLARISSRIDEIALPIHAALRKARSDRLQSFLYRVEDLKESIRERARSIDAQLANPTETYPQPPQRGRGFGGRRRWKETGDPVVEKEE